MKKTVLCCAVLLAGILTGNALFAQEEGSWKAALDKGTACAKDGNIRMATFYFLNALGKTPGNMEVIGAYRGTVQGVIDASADSEVKYTYLIAMETFLQDQIGSVPTDKVETLVQWLDGIEDQKTKLENEAAEPIEDTPEPTEQEELTLTFNELKTALETQKSYVSDSLAMCKEEPKFQDIASYQLQECEQIMRSLIAIQPKLLKEQKIEVANAYADLQTLSQTVLDTKSEMIWNEYLEKEWKTFVQDLDSIRQWTSGPAADENSAPAADESSAPAADESSAPAADENSAPAADETPKPTPGTNVQGIEEQRIALIQKQMGKLQLVLPKLSEKYVGDVNAEYSSDTQNAAACLQKMQKMLKEATEKQRDKYNSWALENIQECNNFCFRTQGSIINGKSGARKIANALIEKLGPIDQMLLTPAIHRCYQEVLNKYLTDSQLYKIEGKKSWKEDYTVGYALLQMDAAEKVQLSQF